jgi:hypothetical protein
MFMLRNDSRVWFPICFVSLCRPIQDNNFCMVNQYRRNIKEEGLILLFYDLILQFIDRKDRFQRIGIELAS